MSVIIRGGSGNLVEVSNLSGTGFLNVNTPDQLSAGFVNLSAESDPGSVTLSRKVIQLEASDDFRLRTGSDQTFFNEYFPGTTLNNNIWNQVNLTMANAVAGGFNTLNSGLSVASGGYSNLRTWRSFPVYMTFPTYCEIDLQFTALTVGNAMEWGVGIAGTNAAVSDGALFRYSATGEFRAVLNTNGSEQLSADLASVLPSVGVMNDYLIVLSEKSAEFWINDILVAVIDRANSAASITSSMNLPVFVRTFNSSATALANTVKVGYVNVSLGDMATNRDWRYVMAGSGGMAYQQQTGAAAATTTALLTNSLAAGVGVAMTNTTAALGSGLGGQFATQPTLAAGTDGIVSSYQVPAGTAAFPGKSLYITGVRVQGAVTTTLVGGPVLYAYSLAFGHTLVTLANPETIGTSKSPRRIALGFETFPATSIAGIAGGGVYMAFNSPVCVQPGEFIQLVAKNLGTVTSAGVITFLVSFDGFFE
jgi:hypothetical protein